MTVNQKIKLLREQMLQKNITAYIVPSSDPHQSEYVAERWKSRTWLSGFTGSAGTVIVTSEHAGLWTDSRYFLQAETELVDSEIVLHQQKIPHAPEHIHWLAEHLPKGSTLAMDGSLFSVGHLRFIAKQLADKDINIVSDVDLMDLIWEDRPSLPLAPIFEHDIKYTGKSREEKIAEVKTIMQSKNASYHFISTLDDIAWLLNLRGSDIEFNPLFIAYCLVGQEQTYLYVDLTKVSPELQARLNTDGIILKSYDSVEAHLQSLKDAIWIDASAINVQLYNALTEEQIIRGHNICRKLKAIKTPLEIKHIRHAMKKDGVALLRLFRWLETTLEERGVTEYELAEKLAGFRAQQEAYFGESFPAIVGYKGNGAIVHYRPMPDSSATIQKDGILLLDSGGQYHDGTTDITRTVALGTPTAEQKRNFTLVLKGYITLELAKFPTGTTGVQLDTLARMHLWQDGLNYGHGTGHGVGFFLNVHEPPQGFATGATTSRGTTALEPGMLTSNEPGFYKTDEYGIRIENLILCKTHQETPYGKFLASEPLTLFPIDTNLIDFDLLNASETQWLKDYHQKVWDGLSPMLEEEEKAWLRKYIGL
jgi:Xaa-Pro aminopeptidase